VFDFIKKFQIP